MFYKSLIFTLRSYTKCSYPFGSLIPGLTGNSTAYRYGFNGKEKDDELKGDGNIYDYGFRMLDPRIGRFFSSDPMFREYPELTPFQYAGNTPIRAKDLDGLEPEYIIDEYNKLTLPVIKLINALFDFDEIMMRNVHFDRNPNMKKTVNAATSSSTSITTNPSGPNKNDGNQWLRTIAHEMRHVKQYKESSFEFVSDINYTIEKQFKGYLNTTDEKQAFAVGDIMTDFTNKHNPASILSNNNLTDWQKTHRLVLEVNKFKRDKLLSTKGQIQSVINQAKKDGNSKMLNEATRYLDKVVEPALKFVEQQIKVYERIIKDEKADSGSN